MEITFYGVRGSIPVPGPGTVRYGGNTGCVLVRLSDGGLIVLDCGTGARTLGVELQTGAFAQAPGHATFLLSLARWDHIQGFPFFRPFYVANNRFTIYGGAASPDRLEQVLESQMAAQYFPLQTFRNMGAKIDIRALPANHQFAVGAARVSAQPNPHGPTTSFSFRIEDAGRVLTYASQLGQLGQIGQVGDAKAGLSPAALALYRDADLLIHDSTFARAEGSSPTAHGLSSVDEAVDVALLAGAKRLALYHYDPNDTDHDIDELVARATRHSRQKQAEGLPIIAAAEGLTIRL
jgi:phosphoribosyl 1,2-cyclic phosphodiesterase